jgi:hypothetical protein
MLRIIRGRMERPLRKNNVQRGSHEAYQHNGCPPLRQHFPQHSVFSQRPAGGAWWAV